MTVQEIYDRYRLMPALQSHQLRVAGVAKIISDAHGGIGKSTVFASLFHDMGNIIKFDLERFPEFLEPEGLEYWKGQKDTYLVRYGLDEHQATLTIAREIGLPEEIIALIDGIGFANLEDIRDHASLEQKVCEYADLRVAPYGVRSMEERLEDARQRYRARRSSDIAQSADRYPALLQAARDIERELFAASSLAPADITEERVAEFFEEFRKYEIKGNAPL